MGFFNSVPEKFNLKYDTVELIKKSKRNSVFLLRKKENGERMILRTFEGSADVYKKLMKISCPNLPQIYSAEEHDGRTVVLEEYVQGDTLYDILCGGVLSEEEAKNIILQLCESLKRLHEIDIVHRDIKPENVIIRGSEAVLIDFDASRTIDPEKNTDTKILGTMGFAAPEQYGISQTDARADIYSLGVMLNVMLTGEHPSIRLASGSFGDVVQKCTMINPDKRYQSAEEVIESIENKGKQKKKHIALAAVILLIFAAVVPAISGAFSENDAFKGTETELFGWNAAGKNEVLPEDFYDYWSADEFIRPEQIDISLSGGLTEYAEFEFEDDVLNITVSEIPQEKLNDLNIGEELYVVMELEAPSEDIVLEVTYQGNGKTYSDMKKQISLGEEIYFYPYYKNEHVTRLNSFANIVSAEGKNEIGFYENGQLFYLVAAWKDAEGNIETQILPYRVLSKNNAKSGSETENAGIHLHGWEAAEGKSGYLPEDFYDYWSEDEFVGASQLILSLPGNMEEYVSYRFEDDILNVIIHEIPEEEFQKYNIGDELYVSLNIDAPSEDTEWVVFHQGNGPTYSNLKMQMEADEELHYSTYDPLETNVITSRPFAKIVSIGAETKLSFYESNQVFYAVSAWKNSEGETEMQILPYRILTENEAKKIFEFDTWMDIFWEPVGDPERIIFREVYGDCNFYSEEEMEEAGFVLEIFGKPGEMNAKTGAVSKIDIETIANAEAYLLPPDSAPKQENETYEEWFERIDNETEYVGYRCGHSTGISNGYEAAENIADIVNKNPFFYINDHHSCATNIMETTSSEIDGTTIWTTKDDTKDVVMVIDWYTEDPNKNPEAKPEKREYLYTAVEPFIYYDSDEIIAGGYCGSEKDYSSVIWNLSSDGKLSISGRGDMADYTENVYVYEIAGWTNETPWSEFSEQCKTLLIGEGITSIGESAFAGMSGLSGKLVIPESVTEIKNNAFIGCGFDCSLNIPGSVKTIGESAFAEWTFGKSGKLVIEEGLEHLGSNAFFGGKFTSVQLPSTLRDIQASAFDRNQNLRSFSISENNPDICIVDDVIYTKDMKILVEVLGTKTGEFTVPDGVKIIGLGAFQWSNLEKVVIPEGIENISRGAFHSFGGEVHIMGRLQSINDFAFYPAGGKKISVYFYGLPPLSAYSADSENPSLCEYSGDIDIFINKEYQNEWELDSKGFWKGYETKVFGSKNSAGSSNLKYSPEKRIDGGTCGANLSWNIDSNGVLIISGKGTMYDYEDVIDSNGYSSNGTPWGKYMGKVKQLYIEEGVETIGENAFHNMKIEGNLKLPSTLKKIGFRSFCANLFGGNLVIPEGVTGISQDAFQAAGDFKNISIPSTAVNIGISPFRYCLAESITVAENNPNFASVNGMLCNKELTEVIQAPDGVTGTLTVPESITKIGKSAFEKLSASRINIMGDIIFIDETAFQAYRGEVAFYGDVGDIKGSAFNNFVGGGMTVYFIDG